VGIRDKQDIQKLFEDVRQMQQAMNLLTSTVNELKATFPQFEQNLALLSERIGAAKPPETRRTAIAKARKT